MRRRERRRTLLRTHADAFRANEFDVIHAEKREHLAQIVSDDVNQRIYDDVAMAENRESRGWSAPRVWVVRTARDR